VPSAEPAGGAFRNIGRSRPGVAAGKADQTVGDEMELMMLL